MSLLPFFRLLPVFSLLSPVSVSHCTCACFMQAPNKFQAHWNANCVYFYPIGWWINTLILFHLYKERSGGRFGHVSFWLKAKLESHLTVSDCIYDLSLGSVWYPLHTRVHAYVFISEFICQNRFLFFVSKFSVFLHVHFHNCWIRICMNTMQPVVLCLYHTLSSSIYLSSQGLHPLPPLPFFVYLQCKY